MITALWIVLGVVAYGAVGLLAGRVAYPLRQWITAQPHASPHWTEHTRRDDALFLAQLTVVIWPVATLVSALWAVCHVLRRCGRALCGRGVHPVARVNRFITGGEDQ
jgi:hypothetical protein